MTDLSVQKSTHRGYEARHKVRLVTAASLFDGRSLGQITNALFEVGGQYRRNM